MTHQQLTECRSLLGMICALVVRIARARYSVIACLWLGGLGAALSGQSALAALTLDPTIPSGVAGHAYGPHTISASGGTAPYSFSLLSGALPIGISFSSAGTFAGTPSVDGTFNFTVRATDSLGDTGTQIYSFTIAEPPVTFSPATIPSTVAGTPYSVSFTGSGGAAPYSFSLPAGSLPVGMSFSSGGVFSGTPIVAGTYNFSIRVTDDNGFQFTRAYSIVVSAPVINITPSSLPNGKLRTPYSATLVGSGGVAPYTFSIASGALPVGVSFSSAGVFAGTPMIPGTYSFVINARDNNGFTTPHTLSIVIPPITLSPSPLPAVTAHVAYSQTLTANEGTAPYTFSLQSGALPVGFAFSSAGILSGTTTATGNFTLSIRATDSLGATGTQSFTLTVAPLSTPTAVADTATTLSNQATVIPVVANDTGYITSIATASLPAHGTVQINGLNITYMPAAGFSGSDSFSYTASNPVGTSAAATVTVTINPLPTVAAPIAVDVLEGQTAQVDLTSSATGGPFTGAAVVSVAPMGAGHASIVERGAGAYSLAFTSAVAFSGTATVTYTLSNAYATSTPGTLTVNVTPRPDPSKDAQVIGLVTSQNDTARRFASGQLSNFRNRLETLRHGGGRGFSNQVSLHGGSDRRLELTELEARDARTGTTDATIELHDSARDVGAASADAGRPQDKWGLWIAGGADFGRRDADDDRSGLRFDTDGLTVGVDYRASERLAFGAGVGYAHDSTRIGGDGTRNVADGYSAAVYGALKPSRATFIDAVIGYGALSFDSRRLITATNEYAEGSRDGDQIFGSITGGFEHSLGRLDLSPYARFDLIRSQLDAFTDSNGGSYALRFEDQSVSAITGSVGVLGRYGYELSFGEIAPRARIELNYDFEGASHAGVSYADWQSSPKYTLFIEPIDRNRALIAAGIDLRLRNSGLVIGLDYESQIASGGSQGSVRLMLQSEF